ncbi:MAG: glutamate--cysteine ligase [Gammaproteobacteria bacterium]|nr:glutamate--cysteine ligase [Gammaproteobacteria bacterium]MBT8134032.1 glutamate--cysteine ligase [Gammaproteobacteria bacterium]NNJ50662.1 glutamate--cysteine ligase [Gammaproteobacteria bacterium]
MSLLNSPGIEEALAKSKIGLEKESLRVMPEGGIAQTPHPAAWGSPLTHPLITTDFSEALTELVTPPCDSISEVIQSLDDIQNFIYRNLDNEILWATSMPCVVAGETSIPLAQYGSSNAAQMKTVYRRGLGLRYGRAMQVIAGVHFNYSFSEEFWQLYQKLLNNDEPMQDFISEQYMGLVRNLLRYGWLVPYLFGASPAVCKSFLNGKRTILHEFNENTYYEPYATSLRLGDIGYQNNKEDLAGIKACYDSLDAYAESLQYAINTPYSGYEEIGVKVNGEYLQLNANILQIENEYYSTVRPKQILQGNEKPSAALKKRGVAYVELRSVDVNAFDPHGINSEQLHFFEVLMLFCLLQESPTLSDSEIDAIDENLVLVAHNGRETGLDLRRGDEKISLQDWASELCNKMKPVASLLDRAHYCENYFSSVKSQIASVFDPDLTPSARMLAEMRENNEGFFHHAQRMSKHHYLYYKSHALPESKVKLFEDAAKESIDKQRQIEAEDSISFDDFLQKYFDEE